MNRSYKKQIRKWSENSPEQDLIDGAIIRRALCDETAETRMSDTAEIEAATKKIEIGNYSSLRLSSGKEITGDISLHK